MGYAAVASLSETIDIILNYHEDWTTPQFQNQIKSLREHSVFLQSFVDDDPNRANNWDDTIREVTDRAEEIVELLLSDSWLEATPKSCKQGKGEYELHYDLHELERVTEEMESVVERVKGGRRTEAMGGSNEELMEIVSRLLEDQYSLKKISIVGSGGTGKTTLARNAYNHPLVVEHFEFRAWIVISQEFSMQGIMSELLRSMKADEGNISYSKVYDELYDRRFLIVLDDIWTSEAWDTLTRMFPLSKKGNGIILTTRFTDVASYAGGHIHQMRLLDEDETWNVVREKIFKGDPCPSQLEYVGKEIARSCEGHPLSVAVVSGILAANQTAAAWVDIAKNMQIARAQDDQSLLNILSLGYTYMPHHLRPCFLFLASFPEDHEIHVSKLIKLWVAEGFLNESEYKSYEEMGEERVEELVRRSLVSVTKRKSNGGIKSITIHDLLRDVCLKQAQIDNFILGGNYKRIEAVEDRPYRRVSTSTVKYDILEGVYGSTIRTIMLYMKKGKIGFISWRIGNVRLLRILDLSNANYFPHLPEAVFDLFHLRYLAFRYGLSISEAISNLENLQTLIIFPKIHDGGMFDKLPEGVWRMQQLRHIIVFPFELPNPKGATTSALENLQTLSRVVDFICSRENLKMLPDLKKIALFYTKKWRDVEEDFELHNLIYLHKLEIFKIEMDWSSFGKEHEMSTHCAFPPTLKKLNLCGLQLAWEAMKIVGSLPNLQVLKLRKNACIGETWETSEGGFSQLTYLLIEECTLVNWITESSHFPRLKCLALHCCLHLKEVPIDMGKIPSIKFIELDNQSKSLLGSAKQIQEDRQSLGYDHLQIRFV